LLLTEMILKFDVVWDGNSWAECAKAAAAPDARLKKEGRKGKAPPRVPS
jgi:hypothetical protein